MNGMVSGDGAWLAVAVGGLLLACSERGEVASTPITASDSAGVTVVTNDLSRLDTSCRLGDAPAVVIGDRKGEEGHELYRVFGATVLSDGRIALVNQGTQEVRAYSPEGELLWASGREGQGPGEFQNAFLLWRRPGDTLWVGDYRPWEFEVFSSDGEWIRRIRPSPPFPNPPGGIGILEDGRMVLSRRDAAGRFAEFELEHVDVLLHDADGALSDSLVRLPNGRWGLTVDEPNSVRLFPWFESFAEYTAGGSRFIYGHGSEAELRVIDTEAGGDPSLVVRWTGLDRSVTEADLEAARDEVRRRYAAMDPSLRERLMTPRIHEDRPVADRLPAFVGVDVGRDDSIWVRLFVPPDTSVARWVRFGADGRFRCELELPDDLEVYEFGADYVLGVRDDDLGVERVVLYRLVS